MMLCDQEARHVWSLVVASLEIDTQLLAFPRLRVCAGQSGSEEGYRACTRGRGSVKHGEEKLLACPPKARYCLTTCTKLAQLGWPPSLSLILTI